MPCWRCWKTGPVHHQSACSCRFPVSANPADFFPNLGSFLEAKRFLCNITNGGSAEGLLRGPEGITSSFLRSPRCVRIGHKADAVRLEYLAVAIPLAVPDQPL